VIPGYRAPKWLIARCRYRHPGPDGSVRTSAVISAFGSVLLVAGRGAATASPSCGYRPGPSLPPAVPAPRCLPRKIPPVTAPWYRARNQGRLCRQPAAEEIMSQHTARRNWASLSPATAKAGAEQRLTAAGDGQAESQGYCDIADASTTGIIPSPMWRHRTSWMSSTRTSVTLVTRRAATHSTKPCGSRTGLVK
jgi:hypothetical protein